MPNRLKIPEMPGAVPAETAVHTTPNMEVVGLVVSGLKAIRRARFAGGAAVRERARDEDAIATGLDLAGSLLDVLAHGMRYPDVAAILPLEHRTIAGIVARNPAMPDDAITMTYTVGKQDPYQREVCAVDLNAVTGRVVLRSLDTTPERLRGPVVDITDVQGVVLALSNDMGFIYAQSQK